MTILTLPFRMRFLLVLLLNSQDIDEIVREIQRQAAARYPQLRIVLTSRYGYVNLERVVKRSDNILLHMVATLEEGLSDAVNRAAICHQLNSFSSLL